MDDSLDAQVRRADPDRWLAARFIADPAARADVVALYALNHELARAGEVASNPLLGEIRLTWWREALEEVADRRPARRHPLVQALAASGFDPVELAGLTEGRLADLDPLPTELPGLEAYLDATAGAVMALAAKRLDAAAMPEQTRDAARAFGVAGLMRSGRWPQGVDGVSRVRASLRAAGEAMAHLPIPAFPATAYAALAAPYARGRRPSEMEKRLRLVVATATGRL